MSMEVPTWEARADVSLKINSDQRKQGIGSQPWEATWSGFQATPVPLGGIVSSAVGTVAANSGNAWHAADSVSSAG